MKPLQRDVEGFLPLKPAVFHVLLALAEEDVHGYGVIQAVRQGSEGLIHMETGTFYRHLRKLIDEGLVAESDARPAEDDPRRGAYYGLTPLGRRVLAAEACRLSRVVATTDRLGLIGGESGA